MSKSKVNESPLETLARSQALLKKLKGDDPAKKSTEVATDVEKKLKAYQELLCRKCKKPSDGRICDSCKTNGKAVAKKKEFQNGSGYIYCYDEEGKVVLKARYLMEKKLGKKLGDHLAVTYKDGNRKNLSEDNLVLVYKTGTPLDMLTCRHCGARGTWDVREPE